jgi:hypothetical protein
MSTSVDRIVDRMRITGLGVVETVVPARLVGAGGVGADR